MDRLRQSVTKEPCKCQALLFLAKRRDGPLRFSAKLKALILTYESGEMVVLHCPFCGGVVQESVHQQCRPYEGNNVPNETDKKGAA